MGRAELYTPARSDYGQIRLTVTFQRARLRHEGRGRVDFRALAKRPEDTWQERHVFAGGSDVLSQYPPTFDHALEVFGSTAALLRWMPGS